MSKSITVVCRGQELKVEEVVGTFYIHKTKVVLGSPILQLPETVIAVSPEEASYLAAALRTLLGEDKPLEPKERIVEPAPVAAPVAAESANKGEGADSVSSGVEATPAELPESVR